MLHCLPMRVEWVGEREGEGKRLKVQIPFGNWKKKQTFVTQFWYLLFGLGVQCDQRNIFTSECITEFQNSKIKWHHQTASTSTSTSINECNDSEVEICRCERKKILSWSPKNCLNWNSRRFHLINHIDKAEKTRKRKNTVPFNQSQCLLCSLITISIAFWNWIFKTWKHRRNMQISAAPLLLQLNISKNVRRLMFDVWCGIYEVLLKLWLFHIRKWDVINQNITQSALIFILFTAFSDRLDRSDQPHFGNNKLCSKFLFIWVARWSEFAPIVIQF